ncbi:MAG: isochorismate synthase, partial [Actinomycetota bacterium]|nr:isochorismate synthase [Actinomycetota bacterium]
MAGPVAIARAGASLLRDDARDRLAAHLDNAVARARATGREVLAAVTVDAEPDVDPTAVVVASRRRGEHWFCLEQPDRAGSALAALGAVRVIESRGPDRFTRVAAQWRALCADALTDPPSAPVAGPFAVGGFAFAGDGGGSPAWAGFPPAALTVPEVALWRRAGQAQLTLSALAAADDTPAELLGRVQRRLSELRSDPLPLLDPAPAERARIAGAMPPEHYLSAVARAVERIRAGELEKVVLARAVDVHAPAPHDPGAILGVLREAFPQCYVLAVGSGDATFVGATPELLVRREGQRAGTIALAGSTRRSADPAVDAHLGEQLLHSAKDREEQAIVARRIQRTLRKHSLWVTAAPDPVLVRMANIQHLATPIRAQLAEPVGAVDLAGMLHPTPAVGGEPFARAEPLIPALEGLDRGWYAGPVGWTDATEDGEFCVGLRCALLRGPLARCYAGVGVVR